jgi:hypothetical protein
MLSKRRRKSHDRESSCRATSPSRGCARGSQPGDSRQCRIQVDERPGDVRIYCATGGEIPRGGFEYETKAQPLTPDAIKRQQQRRAVQQQITGDLSPKEWDKLEAETDTLKRGRDGKRVRIVVGKKSFVLVSGPSMEGPSMDARSSRIKLSQLVNEMIKTRAKFFLVEVPRTKFAERFSLKDAATHLKNEFGTAKASMRNASDGAPISTSRDCARGNQPGDSPQCRIQVD